MYTMKIFGFAILLLLGGRVNANVYEAALAGRDTDPETAYRTFPIPPFQQHKRTAALKNKRKY